MLTLIDFLMHISNSILKVSKIDVIARMITLLHLPYL